MKREHDMVQYWTCMICGKRCAGDRLDERDLCTECTRDADVGGGTGYCWYCSREVPKRNMVNEYMCSKCARGTR